MWRSRVIARRVRSIRGFSHSKSDFPQLHSQVHNLQTLASYRHLENFRSKDLFTQSNAIRFFSSSSTDSVADAEVSTGNNSDVIGAENENNDSFSFGEMWKDGINEANSVLEMDVSDSEIKESIEVVTEETHEVDIDELQRVLSLLKIRDGDSDVITVSLESKLDDMNLNLNEEFVVRVIETPHIHGENLIAFFKWATGVNNGEVFSVTTRSLDALVKAVCKELKKKVAYSLWDFIKDLGVKENNVLTTEMLNSLISVFSRLGKGMAGFEVFNKFEDFSCPTNADSYYFTIEALCRRSIFDRVGLVCERMLSEDKLPEAGKLGSIISYLCKAGMVKEAHSVYLSAKEKQKFPPQPSVNFLITSLCDRKKVDSDSVHLALKMLDDFNGEKQKHAIKQFSCVIQGLCRVNDFEGAKTLLSKMIDEGPPPGNAVFNTIINGLSKSGNMEEAIKTMRIMEGRGLKPDVFAYSVIMSGYAKGGEMEAAEKMLVEAKKSHCKLTPVTYHTMIRGYCKLEKFGQAVKLLNEMESYGVRANSDEYGKLIQSVCLKAANWRMGEKLMEEMERKGLHLNGITKSLVRAVKELEEEAKATENVSVET
ncbi:unnamed protein product [Lactuca virosa]|uniref:Pentacotripeptide-repeat region of PRORP domain-containing protein n=1 Tax=Lactuca virosa TaxID=75947 RepID=A0AAU9LWK8_9ASTR|nr:unnamed protein product [Lactuca virosa]